MSSFAREVSEYHGTVSVAEKSNTDPRIPVGQVVENQLSGLFGAKVTGGIGG
jgi:hypothetical protein